MPIYIQGGKITRYCDLCQTEVVGLFRCRCGFNERVFCEMHACVCSTAVPS